MLRAARSDDDELVVQWMGQLAAVIAARGEPNRAAAVLTEHADRLRGAIQTARGTPQEPGAALALALTLRMQANTYYDAGDFARSATVAREAIAAVAPDSELRQARIAWADGHFWLGVALLGQRAYAEAEAALLQCHEGYVELHVASRWPRQTRRHLARLYEEWDAAEPGKGYAAKAAEWRDKAGEPPTTVEIDSSESPG
jgi:tetratricopeptide (TPR) repeat protein